MLIGFAGLLFFALNGRAMRLDWMRSRATGAAAAGAAIPREGA
jgi:hypothetical protein